MSPTAPSGQFEYPEQGWSDEMNQRKPKMLQHGEFDSWFKELREGGHILAPKGEKLRDFLSKQTEGVVTQDKDPALRDLGDDYEMHTIPEMPGHILVRPKKAEPLVS